MRARVNSPDEWIVEADCTRGLVDAPARLVVRDERYTILFDGALYERTRLEAEAGVPPGTCSDAGLVLAAHRRWNDAAPGRLNGTFTILAWDCTTRTLEAVRDPLGLKPLFRHEDGERVIFSNSLAALVRDPRVRAAVSPIVLAAFVARRLPDQEETFYAGVRRVPQGHVWRFGQGTRGLRRYWDPRVSTAADPLEPGELDALFEQAVARRLGGRGTAIYLSGGIDSVAVATVAAQLGQRAGQTALALSLAVPGDDGGERQRSLAGALAIPQVLLEADPGGADGGALGTALDLAADWPAPLLNPWLPGFLRLNDAAVERGYRSILTGSGGDEWLTSLFLAAELIRQRQLRRLASLGSLYRRSYGYTGLQLTRALWRNGVRALLVSELAPALERRARPLLRLRLERVLPSWLAPDRTLRRELLDRPTSGSPPSRPSGAGSTYDHPLQDAEMEELSELERRSGVVLAHPWFDLDILGRRYRTRPEDLDRGGRAKGLIHQIVERRLPDLGSTQPRSRLASDPFGALLCRERSALRTSLGRLHALGELGVVDPLRLEADFDKLTPNGDASGATRIWNALTLEAWTRSRA